MSKSNFPRACRYLFERTSKITVMSDDFAVGARNLCGDYVPACPRITLTATFDGEWESNQALRDDFNACLSKLMDAFSKHLSDDG